MKPRSKPFIWPSWITGLISREDKCYWRAWFKSHYQDYDKRPDPGAERLKGWTAEHDAMVLKRAETLRSEGYTVKVEDETTFKMDGKTATLSGKLDVVGLKMGVARIIDAKTGKEKEKDKWQVRIYMWAIPKTWLPPGHSVTGEVEYKRGLEPVGPLTEGQVDSIVGVIHQMGSSIEPAVAPSRFECEYCDIAQCKARYKSHDDTATVTEF